MAKKRNGRAPRRATVEALNLNSPAQTSNEPFEDDRASLSWIAAHRVALGAIAVGLLLGLGVMAKNGWLPHTDGLSGKKVGWFGKELPRNAESTWNPFAVLPSPTPPQLSKSYIYAGDKLVSVVDGSAEEVPPIDLAVWRPTTGVWMVYDSATTEYEWGQEGDIPTPGDFDGDGKTDFAVFRPSNTTWYIATSASTSFNTVVFGNSSGDVPAIADYDGDGKSNIAVFRPSAGKFYVYMSSSLTVDHTLGTTGDLAAPGDYDGDGLAEPGVWRPSDRTFRSINSTDQAPQTKSSGISSGTYDWIAVSGDYDGDGKDDYAVCDNNTANWYIRQSTTSTVVTVAWLYAGGVPVPNDYDGDGIADIAVWRDQIGAEWHIRQSSDLTTRVAYWGTKGDVPVPSNYRR